MKMNKLISNNNFANKSKKNIGFISNQQLLQNMRNKSSKSFNRNRSSETSISFIEKKNQSSSKLLKGNMKNISADVSAFQGINIQNINPNSSVNTSCFQSQRQLQKQPKKQSNNTSLIKFLRQNIPNKKLLNQVQSLISVQQPNKGNDIVTKQQASLLAKIQQLYIQKSKLKKQKKALQNRLQQKSKQYENNMQQLRKQNERLHKVILKQSQMITNRVSNEQEEYQDLRRIVLTQAKSIEAFSGRNNNQPNKLISKKIQGKFR